MFNSKLLGLFLVKFIAAYVVLAILWGPIKHTQAEFFRQKTTFFFGNFKKEGAVTFSKQNQNGHEIRASLFNKKLQAAARQAGRRDFRVYKLPLNSWQIGYLPTILFLALLIATPISIKRKLWAALWGLILVQLFILFKLYIKLLWTFNGREWTEVVQLSGVWERLVSGLDYLFVQHIGTAVIIPVFIWIIVSFKKEDTALLLSDS